MLLPRDKGNWNLFLFLLFLSMVLFSVPREAGQSLFLATPETLREPLIVLYRATFRCWGISWEISNDLITKWRQFSELMSALLSVHFPQAPEGFVQKLCLYPLKFFSNSTPTWYQAKNTIFWHPLYAFSCLAPLITMTDGGAESWSEPRGLDGVLRVQGMSYKGRYPPLCPNLRHSARVTSPPWQLPQLPQHQLLVGCDLGLVSTGKGGGGESWHKTS